MQYFSLPLLNQESKILCVCCFTHVLGLQRYEAFLNKQAILKLIFVYFSFKMSCDYLLGGETLLALLAGCKGNYFFLYYK